MNSLRNERFPAQFKIDDGKRMNSPRKKLISSTSENNDEFRMNSVDKTGETTNSTVKTNIR